MTSASNSRPPWARSQDAEAPGSGGKHWEATRAQSPATQIMGDTDADAGGDRDIGQPVGQDQRELFVSCSPTEAMLQQFDVLLPEFVAVHDIGCAVSRRLLAGVATASNRRLQRLVIRRQGYGTPLATLEYLEWSAPGMKTIRLYTTEVDADTASRHALAQALLAHSRLGVLIVGDLPAHAVSAALNPLQEAMLRHWPNRHVLLLPLTAATAVAGQASNLGAGTGIVVRTTPQVMRPAEAWSFISGTWNRLREHMGTEGQKLPALATVAQAPSGAAAATPAAPMKANGVLPADAASNVPAAAPAAIPQPLPMRPMPEVPRDGPRALSLDEALSDYVGRLIRLNGMMSCCVFDTDSRASLAHAGTPFSAETLARQGSELLQAVVQASDGLGVAPASPEIAVTLHHHHLVLRAVPRHPHLMLHAVLDKHGANLTLARLQIQRLDDDFAL